MTAATPEDHIPKLERKTVGGFHVITSPDVEGLYVADRDPKVAEARVEPTIAALERMTARRVAKDRPVKD